MKMRKIIQVVSCMLIATFHIVANAQANLIDEVLAEFSVGVPGSLQTSIEKYLSRYLGLEALSVELDKAKLFIESLEFVSGAECSYVKNNNKTKLTCLVKPKYIIKKIIIDDLPPYLLEGELRRKLPFQVGYVVDIEGEERKEIAELIRARVRSFLRKSGYFGGVVGVRLVLLKNNLDMNVIINISGGGYVRVSKVEVIGESSISKKTIGRMYGRMCLSFKRFFDALTLGTLSCYSRELERETTKNLRQKFAKLGYIQSNIRISHRWVDPTKENQNPLCNYRSDNDKTPRCVELKVEVNQGPLFKWNFRFLDNTSINRGALLGVLASVFGDEEFSRVTNSAMSEEVPADNFIINEVLGEQLTFIEARNVDDLEISESAGAIKKYLATRGYLEAKVSPSLVQEDSEHVLINFDITTGSPYFIRRVQVQPEKFAKYISSDVLSRLVNKRSFLESGHISYPKLESIISELKGILGAKGFLDLEGSFDLVNGDNGAMDLTFYISSSGREKIDSIEFLNGVKEVNEELLALLINCDRYSAALNESPVGYCADSSLVREEISADTKKVEEFYRNRGYLYVSAKSELVAGKYGFKLIFHLSDKRFDDSKVKLTKQKYSGIIISGNEDTRTDVITRLFPSSDDNSDLDPTALKKSIANLRGLGRFSRINQKIVAGENNSDDIYLSLHLAERHSLEVNAAIAFSTDRLFVLEGELDESNLFSSMLRLKTTLGWGFFWGRQSKFNNRIVWPFIFGYPLRFSLNAPTIIYDNFIHRKNPSRRLQTKLQATLEWQANRNIAPYLRFRLTHTQEKKNINLDELSKKSFAQRVSTLDGLTDIATKKGSLRGVIIPGFNFVKLDNPFNPRLGVDLDNSVEISQGIFMGTPPFTNLVSQNRFFFPLGKITIALRATLMRAFISLGKENWDELRNGSSMESLGGDRSVRGYGDGSIGLFDAQKSSSAYQGYFSNIATLEFRFPLTSGPNLGSFFGAFFADQGMVIPCSDLFRCSLKRSFNSSFDERGLGFSIGAALRYLLPVGPISLEYAVSPITGESRFHFLLGYPF